MDTHLDTSAPLDGLAACMRSLTEEPSRRGKCLVSTATCVYLKAVPMRGSLSNRRRGRRLKRRVAATPVPSLICHVLTRHVSFSSLPLGLTRTSPSPSRSAGARFTIALWLHLSRALSRACALSPSVALSLDFPVELVIFTQLY